MRGHAADMPPGDTHFVAARTECEPISVPLHYTLQRAREEPLPKLDHEAIAQDSVALSARNRPKNHFVMVDILINSHVLAFLMVRNASTFPQSRFSDAEGCFQRARRPLDHGSSQTQ